MYNEFAPKHYKGKWPCTAKTLYSEKTLIGRLQQYFLIYFETFSVPTADTLFLLILSILTSESAHSIRFRYQHFLSGITEKSLNVFYYACSYNIGYGCSCNAVRWLKWRKILVLHFKDIRRLIKLGNLFEQ